MIELRWNAPVSESKLMSQIATLSLTEGQRVLDVGCGCGEVLLRICDVYSVSAHGIDNSAPHIEEARRRTSARGLSHPPAFSHASADEWHFEDEALDLIICLGASHAFGMGPEAYRHALQRMTPMIRPGGQLLIAEGYAKQPIPSGYRTHIGETLTDEMTHAARVQAGESLGLQPLRAWTATADEWDEFEWSYQRIVEEKGQDPAADARMIARMEHRREWMEGYLRWGRDTLGYGTYLFRKPRSITPRSEQQD